MPAEHSGRGGDNVLFATVRSTTGYDLTEEHYEMLAKWFNPLCQPPWNDDRLPYKAKEAHQAKSEKPRGHFLKEEEWSDPQSLHSEMRPVKQFDPEMLPAVLRAWVADVAERMQCPIDFVAVGAICALGSGADGGCLFAPRSTTTGASFPISGAG